MPEFAPVISLSSLNGSNGFRLDGVSAGDGSGISVSDAGDINGDGFADLIIGADFADGGASNAGSSYVVFGKASGFPAILDLDDLDGSNGFRLDGVVADDRSGFSVSGAGDFNGDGIDDLIIGAILADNPASAAGSSYIVFGKESGHAATLSLATLDGSNGFRLDGLAAVDLAARVSSAGDINGDGFDDVVIGAAGAGTNGASYVVFGRASGFSAVQSLGTLDGTNGFSVEGSDDFFVGTGVSSAGDFNGDGLDDLILGTNGPSVNGVATSTSYLLFGKASGFSATIGGGTLNGTNGFRFELTGEDFLSDAVSSLGDINGDGFDDVIIGSRFSDPSGENSGSSFVVFGKASGFNSQFDLASLNGSNGFRLDGASAGDQSGRWVSSAGDINGDGFDDILIGAHLADPDGKGAAGSTYVVLGRESGFGATLNLGALDGDDGFRIDGISAGDESGYQVGSMDINKDGFDDVIIGASNAGPGGNTAAGSSYVIFGQKAQSDVLRTGTAIANTINGGVGDDTINALGGNDNILGWEGDDIINGGSGKDRINGGGGADDIAGGSGSDIIVFGGGADNIDGGSGRDMFDFRFLAGGITIDLGSGRLGTKTFTSIESVNGSSQADTITGSNLADALLGNDGADVIIGRKGADVISGGNGNDRLTSGSGADIFSYTNVAQSGTTSDSRDVITDFKHLTDRINIKKIDAIEGGGENDFEFVGTAAFSGSGQVRAVQSGSDTILKFNTQGTSGAEMTILLKNVTASTLTSDDFIL